MYDERFARQYRYEPPSEFPLTSPFTGIVHHLSGPNTSTATQTFPIEESVAGATIPSIHFHSAYMLDARRLAHVLDSLVRVSRRVV